MDYRYCCCCLHHHAHHSHSYHPCTCSCQQTEWHCEGRLRGRDRNCGKHTTPACRHAVIVNVTDICRCSCRNCCLPRLWYLCGVPRWRKRDVLKGNSLPMTRPSSGVVKKLLLLVARCNCCPCVALTVLSVSCNVVGSVSI